MTTPEDVEKFWSLVEKTEDCWLWRGKMDNHGYGYFYTPYFNVRKVHRLVLELTGKELYDGKQIHHKCETRNCVNPEHLEQLTPKEHRKRHRATHCIRGHEFNKENTLYTNNQRKCRICDTERVNKIRTIREKETGRRTDPRYNT